MRGEVKVSQHSTHDSHTPINVTDQLQKALTVVETDQCKASQSSKKALEHTMGASGCTSV